MGVWGVLRACKHGKRGCFFGYICRRMNGNGIYLEKGEAAAELGVPADGLGEAVTICHALRAKMDALRAGSAGSQSEAGGFRSETVRFWQEMAVFFGRKWDVLFVGFMRFLWSKVVIWYKYAGIGQNRVHESLLW